MFSTPAVAEDLLYVGSCSGIFYALDKNTGSVKWSYDITKDGRQTSFHGDMLITEELVIIGTDGRSLEGGIGHLCAFERKAGKVRWKYFAGRGVTTDVLRLGDRIFAVTQNDELICLNVQNGQRDWAFASTYAGNQPDLGHSPALAGDQIFFGGRDGIVYALAANTGKLLWKRKLDGALSASLRTFENHVYAGVAGGRIYALNTKTGAIERNFSVENNPVGKFTPAQNCLFIFLNRSGVPGAADDLICLEPSTQKVCWRQSANPASQVIKPAVANLTVATGNQCKNPESAWSSTSPYVWRDYVLAGSNRGEVLGYRIADGKPAWSHKLGGTIRSFGSSERLIYVGTVEGTIYACALGHEASQ
ncbi:PQQ-like beta-propeller repeat protein [candidate division KSB1 bacterium]|nr:PQQ-like beta-propeller repeat protein [candidate division KSB1 bacterium]